MFNKLKSFWQLLINSEAVKQSALVFLGNIITSVIMAVAMILASRSLGPELFGVFSVSLVIMVFSARVVDSGLNQLMPRFLNQWADSPKLMRAFLGQIGQWKLMLAIVASGAGIMLVPLIQNLLNYGHPRMILWAILGGLVMGLYDHVFLVLYAKHAFKVSALISVVQAVIKCLGFIALFFYAKQWLEGYAAFYFLAPLIASMMGIGLYSKLFIIRPQAATNEMKGVLYKYWKHSALGVIAITLIYNVDILMVQGSLTAYDTGIYSAAGRIALLMSFTVAAMGGVLNNRVSRYKSKKLLKQYLRKSLLLVVAAFIGFLIFLPFSKFILVYSIGAEYLDGLLPLILLTANSFLGMALLPYIAIFYSLEHPSYFSYGYWLQVVIIVIGNYVLLSKYGVVAASFTKLLATLVFAIFTMAYLHYAWKRLED